MGIRFTTNTWRAPLQLIDCWLPITPPRAQPKAVLAPRALQRFIRAGWLNRAQAKSTAACASLQPSSTATERHCVIERHPPATRSGSSRVSHASQKPLDTRLVISGRMGDVCAELERLAALEHTACL